MKQVSLKLSVLLGMLLILAIAFAESGGAGGGGPLCPLC